MPRDIAISEPAAELLESLHDGCEIWQASNKRCYLYRPRAGSDDMEHLNAAVLKALLRANLIEGSTMGYDISAFGARVLEAAIKNAYDRRDAERAAQKKKLGFVVLWSGFETVSFLLDTAQGLQRVRCANIWA